MKMPSIGPKPPKSGGGAKMPKMPKTSAPKSGGAPKGGGMPKIGGAPKGLGKPKGMPKV